MKKRYILWVVLFLLLIRINYAGLIPKEEVTINKIEIEYLDKENIKFHMDFYMEEGVNKMKMNLGII